MKVLLITRDLLDYAVEYANAISHVCDVTLCVPKLHFDHHQYYINDQVDVVLVSWPRHRSLKNILLINRILRIINDEHPSIIHILSTDAFWLNGILPFVRSIPIVTTVHDISFHPGDWKSRKVPGFVRDSLIRRSTAIFVHGRKLKNQASQCYHIDQDTIYVIHHVARLRYQLLAQQEQLIKKNDGKFRVLFFGRILEYKGLEYFLKSAALVKNSVPNVIFVVAGEGEELKKYSALVENQSMFDIRNRRIPDLEVAQLFTDADIVALPYIEASQSGVIPISMCFGKSVIVTDVGSLAEPIEEGEMGLIIPPRDQDRLGDAIIKLSTDTSLRRKMEENALSFAHTERSPKEVGTKALEHYNLIIAGHRKCLSS